MVWSFGRSFSPSVSGNLQVGYGFGPPFLIAIVLYAVAICFIGCSGCENLKKVFRRHQLNKQMSFSVSMKKRPEQVFQNLSGLHIIRF